MNRKFLDKELLLASNNNGKILEIKELLLPYNISISSASDFQITEPEETGITFADNAKLKAEYYGKIKNTPALADDSGLSIKNLDGFPGVYSARLAGENKDFTEAFKIIEQKLLEKGLTSSSAFFTCCLALRWPDGHFEVFEAKLHGKISFPATGSYGFGYGPIFIPDGHNKTLSQMPNEQKNAISHRALAFNQMIDACFN